MWFLPCCVHWHLRSDPLLPAHLQQNTNNRWTLFPYHIPVSLHHFKLQHKTTHHGRTILMGSIHPAALHGGFFVCLWWFLFVYLFAVLWQTIHNTTPPESCTIQYPFVTVSYKLIRQCTVPRPRINNWGTHVYFPLSRPVGQSQTAAELLQARHWPLPNSPEHDKWMVWQLLPPLLLVVLLLLVLVLLLLPQLDLRVSPYWWDFCVYDQSI